MTAAATRLPDAVVRLGALLFMRQGQPFAWGARDCCDLAFDAHAAVTGRDVFGDLRGTYRTAAQAWRLLRGLGGLAGLCAARLGPEVSAAAAARDGDIALVAPLAVRGARTGALAVWWRGRLVAQGHAGLVGLSADFAARTWRVG